MDASYQIAAGISTSNPLGVGLNLTASAQFSISTPIFSNCGLGGGFLPFSDAFPTTPPSITGSKIPYYHQLLCEWATGFPTIFHWVVLILPKNPNYFRETIIRTMPSYEKRWSVTEGFDATFNDFTQKTIGCIFAHNYRGVDEGVGHEVSTKNRGFVSSPLLSTRENNHSFSISFKETNSSFLDSVMKPWVIMTSHKGLIARPNETSLKADIVVYELTRPKIQPQPYDEVRMDAEESAIRKVTTYYDCAPIKVNNYELKTEMSIETINVDFVFNTYSIETA